MREFDDSFREVRCGLCFRVFYICRSCDRGQIYCSDICSEEGHARSRRAANRRHQDSPEGKFDHAARQADWRRRQKVTDQGPQEIASSGRVCVDAALTATMVVAPTGDAGNRPDGPPEDADRPNTHATRLLVTHGQTDVLKAVLPPPTQVHPHAAGMLLEAVSLWFARPLYAVLVADAQGASSELGLCDGGGAGRKTPRYEVEIYDRSRHRTLGSFADSHQVALRGVL